MISSSWTKYVELLSHWADRLLNCLVVCGVAFVLWMFLQLTSLVSFRIPTDSMQPTLIPGDHILVEKWTMGGRIFDLLDAAEEKEVEIRRLPGWGKVKRNDVLVFNFSHHHRWDSISMDLMVYYVKRCIGLPGDTVSIRNSYYLVAGVADTLGNVPAQRSLERLMASDKVKGMGVAFRSFPEDSVRGWNIVGGDNVLNSQDSRYWGLLPEEYIVGRAIRIWKSVDKHTDEMRWERFMKKIE